MSELALEDEILACKARCAAYIERRIDELAAESPNVPRDVIRNIVWRRSGRCHCRCVLVSLECAE
jgi:hypothetical protein